MIPLVVGIALGLATPSPARTLGDRRKAAWLSVGHPGLGELLQRWIGGLLRELPAEEVLARLDPLYGWPGYLQVLSAIDAYHGRTSDNLCPID
jgi:hypothetical protein